MSPQQIFCVVPSENEFDTRFKRNKLVLSTGMHFFCDKFVPRATRENKSSSSSSDIYYLIK